MRENGITFLILHKLCEDTVGLFFSSFVHFSTTAWHSRRQPVENCLLQVSSLVQLSPRLSVHCEVENPAHPLSCFELINNAGIAFWYCTQAVHNGCKAKKLQGSFKVHHSSHVYIRWACSLTYFFLSIPQSCSGCLQILTVIKGHTQDLP